MESDKELLPYPRTWAQEDLEVETSDDGSSNESEGGTSAVQSPPRKKLRRNVTVSTELSSSGTKIIDKIMSHMVEDGFMEQLEAHFLSKASQIVHAAEFRTSLRHQNVLRDIDIQQATGRKVQEGRQNEKAIKVACSKRAISSLVLALESSSNDRILLETYIWLETFQVRKKNHPISVKSLGNQSKPTPTGLFVATARGLISLDLRTLEATVITSEACFAVAVNHNLKKVYWSEDFDSSRIMRSNFDGSAKETIVPPTGDIIMMLAVDETSGNLYFTLEGSHDHEITVCSALGKNCRAVVFNPSLVNLLVGFALDPVKGFMYWGNRGSRPNSLVRANLDGSNAAIIATGFNDLCGITLEQPSNGILYWADGEKNTIGTIDVSGGNKRTLVRLEGNPKPWGIQVDAHNIYFCNLLSGNIQSVKRDSGNGLTTIFNFTGYVYDLALFSAPV